MANPDLEKFIMRLANDAELKKEFKERSIPQLGGKGISPYDVIRQVMVEMGAAYGYSFSLEDLKDVDRIFHPVRLDDKELDNVTGGTGDEEYIQNVITSLTTLLPA